MWHRYLISCKSVTSESRLANFYFIDKISWQVKKVNGVEIENLRHLCHLVEDNREENVRFDLDDERVIVLNYDSAKFATSKIMKRHRIPSAMSDDLVTNTGAEIEVANLS